MENRKYSRVLVDELSADFSDGVGFFSGKVEDISQFGLCLTEIARSPKKDDSKLTLVVSGLGRHFKFNVLKKWEKKADHHRTIGVAVEEAPLEWIDFVRLVGKYNRYRRAA